MTEEINHEQKEEVNTILVKVGRIWLSASGIRINPVDQDGHLIDWGDGNWLPHSGIDDIRVARVDPDEILRQTGEPDVK